jgi:hypothetical protein
MAAFADFSELVIAVGEYLNRADLVDVMPRFVAMAETKINRRLRDRRMLTTVTLMPDANGACALPADFLEAETVIGNTASPIVLEAAAGRYGARYTVSGNPSVYNITGSSLVIKPISSATIDLTYFAAVPGLDTNQTNWLVQAYPDLYLYAAVFEAATYVRDTDSASAAAGLFQDAMAAAEADNARARWSNVGFRNMEANP